MESLDWIHDRWTVNNGGLTADHVFLTTGGDPKEPEGYPDIPVMLLDDALIPQRLAGGCPFIVNDIRHRQQAHLTRLNTHTARGTLPWHC